MATEYIKIQVTLTSDILDWLVAEAIDRNCTNSILIQSLLEEERNNQDGAYREAEEAMADDIEAAAREAESNG
jgi:hypothetical protein